MHPLALVVVVVVTASHAHHMVQYPWQQVGVSDPAGARAEAEGC